MLGELRLGKLGEPLGGSWGNRVLVAQQMMRQGMPLHYAQNLRKSSPNQVHLEGCSPNFLNTMQMNPSTPVPPAPAQRFPQPPEPEFPKRKIPNRPYIGYTKYFWDILDVLYIQDPYRLQNELIRQRKRKMGGGIVKFEIFVANSIKKCKF